MGYGRAEPGRGTYRISMPPAAVPAECFVSAPHQHLLVSTGLSMEHEVLHIDPEARGPPKQCSLL
jgi:hypothetical protein